MDMWETSCLPGLPKGGQGCSNFLASSGQGIISSKTCSLTITITIMIITTILIIISIVPVNMTITSVIIISVSAIMDTIVISTITLNPKP